MSETKTLLLDLHCEEIPARFLKPLTEELASGLDKLVLFEGLSVSATPLKTVEGYVSDATSSIETFYSPRKLAWRIAALKNRQ